MRSVISRRFESDRVLVIYACWPEKKIRNYDVCVLSGVGIRDFDDLKLVGNQRVECNKEFVVYGVHKQESRTIGSYDIVMSWLADDLRVIEYPWSEGVH